MLLRTRQKTDNYRQEVILRNGDRIILRPINLQDKAALKSFYSRLSEDTRFLRYQYHKGELSDAELDEFCDIDYENTLALVAEKGPYGQREIVAVGRFYRLDDPRFAEVAFVVQDSEQGKGIGTELLKHLALQARRYDIEYFVGEVFRNNGAMMSIFRKADPGMENDAEGSTCSVSVSVAEVIHSFMAPCS